MCGCAVRVGFGVREREGMGLDDVCAGSVTYVLIVTSYHVVMTDWTSRLKLVAWRGLRYLKMNWHCVCAYGIQPVNHKYWEGFRKEPIRI